MKQNKNEPKRVVFVGGETGGPVSPLIAVAKQWQYEDPNIQPIFFDIRKSVASKMVPKEGYKFISIFAGKFRRYFSFKNFLTPFQILLGLSQSLFLLWRLKPIVVVGAGGYVQIPVIIASWILRIPRVIHQQDIQLTLANKICAPFATKVTTSFEKSVKDFPQGLGLSKNYAKFNKVVWTGNPCLIKPLTKNTISKEEAYRTFNLQMDWPTVLVSGGGSGALGLNSAVIHSLPSLLKVAQIIHSTGVGRAIKPPIDIPAVHDRYHQFEFINNMDKAYAAADVVISRAGAGSITELSVMAKISIIVPMPDSHQENNAQFLYEQAAAYIIDQRDITPETFAKLVRKILFDVKIQKQLQTNIQHIMPENATGKMLKEIQKVINE